VGSLPDAGVPAATPDAVVACITGWMRTRAIDAAVRTAPPARFAGVGERAPSAHEALAFLDGRTGEPRARTEEYVRRIPADVRTLYRGPIEARLDWTPRV
jgi:hypothetical protein